MKTYINLSHVFSVLLVSCGPAQSKNSSSENTSQQNNIKQPVLKPEFNADSAYYYVAKQLEFGNRIPNTAEHKQTAEWLASELKRHGATVISQDARVTAFDGTTLNAINIIGSYNPEKEDRIMLYAHWDSRPFADHEPDVKNQKKPVPGANDGASGVGVLLELARQLNLQNTDKGIDIIFFDAEDYGTPEFYVGPKNDDTWALGTQYWAKRMHKPAYRARYGILLDMVGAKDATFKKEGFSRYYAQSLVNDIWSTAASLGYGNYFVEEEGGYITDDHYYINKMRRIPSIDIIDLRSDTETGFYPYWHTTHDTLDKIDKNTLNAVGETVITYILK